MNLRVARIIDELYQQHQPTSVTTEFEIFWK